MSVGPILTLGLGAFTDGGVQFLPTLGYGTGGAPPNPPQPYGRSGLGGDDVPRYRKSPHRGWDRKAWRAAQDDVDAVEATLKATYAGLTGADAAISTLAQVDAIVRPVARQEARDVPLRIDWAKMARDFQTANRLMALARAEAELQAFFDDEDDVLMLLQ